MNIPMRLLGERLQGRSISRGGPLAIGIVVAPFVDEGGIKHTASALSSSLASLGHRVELHVPSAGTVSNMQEVRLYSHNNPAVSIRFGFSRAWVGAAIALAAKVDIIHINSLWMFPNIVPGLVTTPDQGAKLVVSPHGTLAPWAMNMSKWKKRVAWWLLGQRLTLTRAACFHATAESEYEDIRRLGFRQPVAIIPNGIDIPALPLGEPRRGERSTLLFLGRVHRIKGVDQLLHAWGALNGRYPEWDLAIVGPSDPPGYLDEMQALATRLGLARVSFPGVLYGSAKSEAYWNADLFVLPTHSENFGLVIGEALAHACPVITTREAPWAGLETERCGWWIEDSLEALTAALDHAMSLGRGALAEMGTHGRAWMERDFGWDGIAQQMSEVYLWLLGRGDMPACVVAE